MEDIMKQTMLSERKRKEERKSFICSKAMNCLVMTAILVMCAAVTCFAGDGSDAINTAKGLLGKAASAGGGLWAVWGIVQLGMAIKDHNGPGMGGAIWQIIGGAIIIAAGVAINALDLSMTV
jgi:hypothetical protein